MWKLVLSFIFLFSLSYSYEDFVQYEKGYYYVEIKKGSFENVNSKLLEEIKAHQWDVIHTINVDKTVKMKSFYKTHLLCKAKYLREGVQRFKAIGVIIPCKMAIFTDGNTVKIMVEDVSEYGKIYAPGNREFEKFLIKVRDELIDILNRTASRFMKSKYTPYE
ncbi:Uncharacterized conserved protein, DUF302 family [Persephonella hydrogeniphila]|uniref:Uncharacterized conserved protein, DUF302 family n=1 Tax=Persephonella hydrogeniphila TaxID=198703 RepID=A0A285NQB6_9AQUI|nr:DUF302 domain-containing protein [Persephonella hydrogeniphila]SNZ11408.1 Uncharacterized conserved protein, DUF302 family [Persephonella hydrogeniphila]